MAKQEMARVNINILGVSELKWMGMGKFNSEDHVSTTVDKNPFEKVEQSTKESEVQCLGAVSKNNRMISVCFQGKPFNITVIQAYAPTIDVEEAEFD